MSFPFKPAGEVISVDTLGRKMIIKMNYTCLPSASSREVKMAIPSSKKAFEKVQRFVSDAMDLGKLQAATDFGKSAESDTQAFQLPAQDLVGRLKLPHPLPYIADSMALPNAVPVPASGHPIVQQIFEIDNDDDRHDAEVGPVCAVAQRKHGQIIRKKFDLPDRQVGDRILANIAVTGHGWQYTQEQCGEYCEIMYSLKFNNGRAINLTQWRGDCKANPHGPEQHGTWDESRNGWCPGTVEPGAIVDVTDHLTPVTTGATAASPVRNDGIEQTVTLDILTWSAETARYEPFSNVKGWIFGDQSMLKVALSLHVYPKTAYATAMRKFTKCTSVEAAMHNEGKVFGDETAAVHKPPTPSGPNLKRKGSEESLEGSHHFYKKMSLKQQDGWGNKAMVNKAETKVQEDPWNAGASCWRFRNTAPWYNTHNEGLEALIAAGHATRVPVLSKVYMHSGQRYATIPLDLKSVTNKHFSQVGLHLKLEKPDGMEFDHWDRVGSVGLEFAKSSASAHVRRKSESKPMPLDPDLVDANWDSAPTCTMAFTGFLMTVLAFFA